MIVIMMMVNVIIMVKNKVTEMIIRMIITKFTNDIHNKCNENLKVVTVITPIMII